MKYLFIILGVLLAVPVFAYMAGLFISESHTATASREFDVSAEKVWQAVTDVRGYGEWRNNVERIEVLSDSTRPLQWREFYSNDNPMTFQEVERTDSTRFTARIADQELPFGGGWTYELEQTEKGVRLIITEDGKIYNPIFRFVSRFIIGYKATMNRFLDDLEKHLDVDS